MKILVLGGTQFIGKHVVEKLILANHDVTLLNRGKTSPGLFAHLPIIKADRESSDLKNNRDLHQDWDAVIDLCAYFPKDVRNLLEILKGRAGRYILCSSVSAYDALTKEGPIPILDEESPLCECTQREALDPTLSTYGHRKAECERVAMDHQASDIPAIVIRPSVVYGAYDPTDRFAYWIWRCFQETPFLLPDDGLTITRRTYAPDLASAFVACLNSRSAIGNAYNIAETDPLSFRDTICLIGNHLNKNPLDQAVSVSSEWLLNEGVKAWSDLPLWLPRRHLLIDTFKSRKDLSLVSTPPAKALAEATDAFLAENRAPTSGLSQSAEYKLLKKLKTENAI